MIQNVEVVFPAGKEKASPLFHHDGLEFDILLAHLLASEIDQEIRVVGKNGVCKQKIPFCKVFSLASPRSCFFYKGSLEDSLRAFSFDEGDILSFEVRNGGALADKGFKEQLIEYYAVYKTSPLLGNISTKGMHDFVDRLREARKNYHREPPKPLIFGVKKPEEPLWT
jgi:hypothetical protein